MALQTVHAIAIDGEGSTAVYIFPDEAQARDVYEFAASYQHWREAIVCRFACRAPLEATPDEIQAVALAQYLRGLTRPLQQRRIVRFTPARLSQREREEVALAMADFRTT
jgi:hypothetical protein